MTAILQKEWDKGETGKQYHSLWKNPKIFNYSVKSMPRKEKTERDPIS